MLCIKYLFYFWLLAASEGNRRPGSPYLSWRLWVIPLSFLVPIFPTANGYETHCPRSASEHLAVPGYVALFRKCSAGSPVPRPSAFAAPVGVPPRMCDSHQNQHFKHRPEALEDASQSSAPWKRGTPRPIPLRERQTVTQLLSAKHFSITASPHNSALACC